METYEKIFIVVIVILSLVIGYFSNNLYREYTNERNYNGLFIPKNWTQAEALKTANQFDNSNGWICVNIKGMSIQDVINTCEHEASHEIFAQSCTGRPLECLKDIGVKNESN